MAANGSITTRLGDAVKDYWKDVDPSNDDSLDALKAKLDVADKSNAQTYMDRFDYKPMQRDAVELPLNSSFYQSPQQRRQRGGQGPAPSSFSAVPYTNKKQ
jgi:hypothetical protein